MKIIARVVAGYGVASGQASASDTGTIARQKPFFKTRGLNIDHCFNGTINLDIAPLQVASLTGDYCFNQVKWDQEISPEDFFLVNCVLWFKQRPVAAHIYYPSPETKPDHFQPNNVLEVVAPYIDGLNYGDKVILQVNSDRLSLT